MNINKKPINSNTIKINSLKMPKLKPTSIGFTLGLMLAILYTLRTIALWLFPNFIVNVANKVMYKMIAINLPVITIDAFVIGIIALFIGGFVFGVVFSLVYNKIAK